MAENAADGMDRPRVAAPASLAAFVDRVLLWAVLAFSAWYAAGKPVSLACGWIGSAANDALRKKRTTNRAMQSR